MSNSVKSKISLAMYVSVAVIVLMVPYTVSESVSDSLQRCAKNLLPSIFPMMILSRQISSLLVFPKGHLSSFLSTLTGFSEALLPVFFSGMLCGYPIPAIICKSKLDLGLISKEEAVFATNLTNGASPGFLIFFVGSCLAKSVRIGLMLCLCQISATVIVSHIISCPSSKENNHKNTYMSLSENVKSSTINFVELCGFVIFFSLLSTCVSEFLQMLSTPLVVSETVSGIFEITGFIEKLAPFSAYDYIPLCLLCASGGLSVCFQVSAVMKDCGFSLAKFLSVRLFVGAVMALLFIIFT